MAARPHRPPGAAGQLIHHSDAGSQYTSIRFTEMLALKGVSASIGSVGDAYDALAETIGLYKNEAIRPDSPFHAGPLTGLADVERITPGLRRLVQPDAASIIGSG